MKAQATVLLGFQARTLEEAGALLDDVLRRARERDDVEVAQVELATPPGDRMVTLPAPSPAAIYAPPRPSPPNAGNGA